MIDWMLILWKRNLITSKCKIAKYMAPKDFGVTIHVSIYAYFVRILLTEAVAIGVN